MSASRPKRAARGSRTGRPIMQLLDWLGRRWALRVLWELRGGAASFRALQELCDAVSPTVLNDRLRELRELGIVELREGGYVLTAEGRGLGELLMPLHAWAERWARRARTRRAP
jgi:DNA-binding HxlR family transcriptional regulator